MLKMVFSMSHEAKVKKFLRFHWRGKLYEWKILHFCLKCSPWIWTFMVKPIISFLHSKNISLTAHKDNFIMQAKCECKVIFEIYEIAWCSLVNKMGENYSWPDLNTDSSWFPLGYLGWDYFLAWVNPWAKKLLVARSTTQEKLECFVGTFISTQTAVWKESLPRD